MCIVTYRSIRKRSRLRARHEFGGHPYDGKETGSQVRQLERFGYTFVAPERQNELTRRIQENLSWATGTL